MLQAAVRMQLHVREPDFLDQDGDRDINQPGLYYMEQHEHDSLLRLSVVQGRRGRQSQVRLEEGRHSQHHLPGFHRDRVLGRVLRVQE